MKRRKQLKSLERRVKALEDYIEFEERARQLQDIVEKFHQERAPYRELAPYIVTCATGGTA